MITNSNLAFMAKVLAAPKDLLYINVGAGYIALANGHVAAMTGADTGHTERRWSTMSNAVPVGHPLHYKMLRGGLEPAVDWTDERFTVPNFEHLPHMVMCGRNIVNRTAVPDHLMRRLHAFCKRVDAAPEANDGQWRPSLNHILNVPKRGLLWTSGHIGLGDAEDWGDIPWTIHGDAVALIAASKELLSVHYDDSFCNAVVKSPAGAMVQISWINFSAGVPNIAGAFQDPVNGVMAGYRDWRNWHLTDAAVASHAKRVKTLGSKSLIYAGSEVWAKPGLVIDEIPVPTERFAVRPDYAKMLKGALKIRTIQTDSPDGGRWDNRFTSRGVYILYAEGARSVYGVVMPLRVEVGG